MGIGSWCAGGQEFVKPKEDLGVDWTKENAEQHFTEFACGSMPPGMQLCDLVHAGII